MTMAIGVYVAFCMSAFFLSFHFWQTTWPALAQRDRARDLIFSAVTALFGPIAMFALGVLCAIHFFERK